MTVGKVFQRILFLIFFSTSALFAQTSRGTVSGNVTDPSGAAVVGATVTLRNVETSVQRDTKTNAAGIYTFEAVDLGTYELTVSASGFGASTVTGIGVQAAHTSNINFPLKIGGGKESITVEGSASEVLQTTEPLRGGTFETRSISQLPLAGLDSLNLILLIPGAQSSTTTLFSNGSNQYSINGARARGNNFMIDGVENNDISVAGPAFQITNTDAIQEVNVQTSNFSAEFGRAGGAVVNQITKSGTNSLHGSVQEIYDSQVFNAESNGEVNGGSGKAKFVRNRPDFTIGGPVVIPGIYNGRNKTFFFGAGQWQRFFSTAQSPAVTVPTAAGVATLQALSAQCPNVATYLQALGGLRGFSNLSNVSIAAPTATGTCTGTTRAGQTVQFGQVNRTASSSDLDYNYQIRVDHNINDKQFLSARWIFDKEVQTPGFNNLDGFDNNFNGRTMGIVLSHTYVIKPTWTNELRFNFGRIEFLFPATATDSFHTSLLNYSIAGITGFGLATNIPQGRIANNYQYQETMSIVKGRHTFRTGVDYLRQLASQVPPFNARGSLTYNSSTGAGVATGLSNFLDDFAGNSGSTTRSFGNPVYRPNLFRQAYFGQDSWKVSDSLTLQLGLRYEYFGQPANIFRTPAITASNFDPTNFTAPNQVNPDKNNFGPSVGFAWAPKSGWMMGDGKTVFRGGFQVSYDSFFNNLLSNIAGSSPNVLQGLIQQAQSASAPRGVPNLSVAFTTLVAAPPKPTDPQSSLLDPNIRNPYTQRFSFGVQRELPQQMILDVSYVGSLSRKLFETLDVNPLVPGNPGTGRLVSTIGARSERCSCANSSYNSLQTSLKRRFAMTPVGQFGIDGDYTWSHNIDNSSEVFQTSSTATSFQSLPQVLGFSPRVDRGNSDNDRRHRFVFNYVWDIRGPKSGIFGQVLGGWSLAGVSSFQTGAPFTVRNGSDRNLDGQSAPDRPDLGNPLAPLNTRAQTVTPSAACPSGLVNPDAANACVTAADVHWIQGVGLPNANTAGRNITRTPGLQQWDLDVIKNFKLTERIGLQYKAEFFNVFNHYITGNPNTTGVVPALSVGTTRAGQFLNYSSLDSIPRTARMHLKITF